MTAIAIELASKLTNVPKNPKVQLDGWDGLKGCKTYEIRSDLLQLACKVRAKTKCRFNKTIIFKDFP